MTALPAPDPQVADGTGVAPSGPHPRTATPDWLALRAGADDRARSSRLAARLSERLPEAGALTLHDLGSGTGAMVRWLAPQLPGPQEWVLHDGDPGILLHADLAGVRDRDGRPIAVDTRIGPLGALEPDAFAGASALTASALLDVLTRADAERIVAACVAAGMPALFSLTVVGSVVLAPPTPFDAELAAAFDDHQRRDGRLGPDAVPFISELFAAAGWNVQTDDTPWRLGHEDEPLIAEWLDGWLDAAVEQRPELADAARARRDSGVLCVIVGHEDVLAWP
ncbi:SAM-dependent methyltransferase [Microbacterium candidum]|uniref:SAM-dependent methyltransferase n=1 Tax=Microbacterium candidum TaxID=3041922 RepID=A0ABT7MVG0_9MICO|nr:SAM-dependent methyltransferase [Microbacterium sp. ASV49]MDL9978403.1 SAM-dependent methyltransferase [Microbacterium sp. ASV49]